MEASIPSLRTEVVRAMREVNAANENLRFLTDALEAVTTEAIAQIEHGTSALELVQMMNLAGRRESMNAAGIRLRKGRHEVQRAMFLLAVAEGASRAEIARVWGVSRQLVSRMTGEAAEHSLATDGPHWTEPAGAVESTFI